ncbi:MAG: hypothetical protein HKM98_08685, partial [Gammaproteobacteria bacterium]|nr:hypothetical protein [Gammaproteobacteria bacterium]
FAEASYGFTAVDVAAPLDGDGDGPQVFGSYNFYEGFSVFGGAGIMDFSKDNIELENLEVGFGWHTPLASNASAFVNVSYLSTMVNVGGAPDFDQDGYGIALGYRAENRSPWEFIASVDYVNVESAVEFGGSMALVYDATRHLSLTGGFSFFDESTSGYIGVRYFFDRNH